MPFIPPHVADSQVSEELAHAGLKRIHQGKVRDTYALLGHPDKLLVVATDRISIFDFVLGALVPFKGEVLTALTVYFLTVVLFEFTNHLVAYGAEIDAYLPETLRRYSDLQKRALVVHRRHMMPIECIVRGVLTGSAWEKYTEGKRELWGYKLPDGLHDGAWLDLPMFTPTDKAESGHDEPVTREFVAKHYGHGVEEMSLILFEQIRQHARTKGIIYADIKFEYDLTLMLCDEVATPDSSRCWDVDEYNHAQAEGRAPSGYDKEPVRTWGKAARVSDGAVVNISKLDAKDPATQKLVGEIVVPAEVLASCTQRYLALTERLTGQSLVEYQKTAMRIAV